MKESVLSFEKKQKKTWFTYFEIAGKNFNIFWD